MRTSHLQYLNMLEFMERHGDLSKPSAGSRGRHWVQERWKELTKHLNSDGIGDSRPEEKWRKVWSDWKNNCKKKVAKIERYASETGGGPALKLSLTDLENRVVQIIGLQAAIGMPLHESRVQQDGGQSPQPQVVEEYSVVSEDNDLTETKESPRSSPPPSTPASDEERCQPPPTKKRRNEEIAQLFERSDVNAREYARERDRVNEELDRERLRQRDEELRLRDVELRERVRQRDAELQLQARWLEFMRECMNVFVRFFGRQQ